MAVILNMLTPRCFAALACTCSQGDLTIVGSLASAARNYGKTRTPWVAKNQTPCLKTYATPFFGQIDSQLISPNKLFESKNSHFLFDVKAPSHPGIGTTNQIWPPNMVENCTTSGMITPELATRKKILPLQQHKQNPVQSKKTV